MILGERREKPQPLYPVTTTINTSRPGSLSWSRGGMGMGPYQSARLLKCIILSAFYIIMLRRLKLFWEKVVQYSTDQDGGQPQDRMYFKLSCECKTLVVELLVSQIAPGPSKSLLRSMYLSLFVSHT